MASFRVLAAAIALAAAALARAQAPPSYDPVAAPAATVAQGRWRLTVLTPNLVRAEAAANASAPAWDDRATVAVVNRRLPVPAFSATPLNASALSVATAALTIVLVDLGGGSGPVPGLCDGASADTDTGAGAHSAAVEAALGRGDCMLGAAAVSERSTAAT